MSLDYLSDKHSQLKEYYAAKNPFIAQLKRTTQARFEPGANITGELAERLRAIWEYAGMNPDIVRRVFAAPGDRTLDFSRNNTPMKVGLALPVGYDIWYLMHTVNVLKFWDADRIKEEYKEIDPFILEKMEAFFEAMHEVKPLKMPLSEGDKTTTGTGWNRVYPVGVKYSPDLTGMDMAGVKAYYVGNDELYHIKEMRFETMLRGASPEYPSPREKLEVNHVVVTKTTKNTGTAYTSHDGCSSSSQGKAYDEEPVYLSFPVGPLGVMEVLSLVSESMITGTTTASGGMTGSVKPFTGPAEPQTGNEFFPPWGGELNVAVGQHLIESAYLTQDDEGIEYLAADFDGEESVGLHKWLRYWIPRDYTRIIPGEFVAILAKPWPLHVWWFQETSPFIYSGNWMETEFYTSGLVKEVIIPWTDTEEDCPSPPDSGYWDATQGTGEVGNRYKVWVKNEEVILKSSDWYEYEVDDRVGILKKWWDAAGDGVDGSMGPAGASGQTANFNWKHLELKNNDEDLETLVTDWIIVPVGFYES